MLIKQENLKDHLKSNSRLLGLDLGTKTIGMAISDQTRQVASPLPVIRRKKLQVDLDNLFDAIADYAPDAVIIGLPLNMDGTEGPRCQATRQFARDLMKRRDLPTLLWDERLSTAAVQRQMIAADMSRAKRAEKVDSMAAAYILESCMDWLKQNA